MKKIIECAIRLLARREHSKRELRHKLLAQFVVKKKAVYEEGTYENLECSLEEMNNKIEVALIYCEKQKWLDDARFAEQYIRYRIARGYGPNRIKQELQQKGVDSELSHAILKEHSIDWPDQIKCIVAKRFGPIEKIDYKTKIKIINYLVNKGFIHETIFPILNDESFITAEYFE